jgi:hypothetical protein
MKKIINGVILLVLLISNSGCAEDYLDTRPTNADTPAVVFETTEEAAKAVNGLARLMVSTTSTGIYAQNVGGSEGTIKWVYGCAPGNTFTALGATTYGVGLSKASGIYHDDPTKEETSAPWWYYYRLIGNANGVLFYIDDAKGPDSEKKRLKAQALTFRSYAFAMLIQLYGYRWSDDPEGESRGIILRLKPTVTAHASSSLGRTYKQIYDDLDEAIKLFQESGWKRPANDYWTPNINVAYAVYARAAINKLDYEKAIEMSVKAREGYPLMTVAEYQSGFCNSNQEWIWGSYAGDEQHINYHAYHSYMAYNGYAANSTAGGTKRIVKDYYDQIPTTDIRKGLFLSPDAAGDLSDTIYIDDNGKEILYPSFDALNGEVKPKTLISVGVRPNVRVDTVYSGQPLIDYIHNKYPILLKDQRICTYMQFKIACNDMPGIACLNHIRSSEMYLIEAEAQYKLGNETRAQQLLVELTNNSDVAKKRDPSFTCTETGVALWNKIKFTAQIELWGEGFDWFMTKRWGDRIVHKSFSQGGNYLDALQGEYGPEEMNKQTWVIPQTETDYNPLARDIVDE